MYEIENKSKDNALTSIFCDQLLNRSRTMLLVSFPYLTKGMQVALLPLGI